MIQHKSFDLDFKDDDGGGFTAYFAAFGNVDRTGELIEPGAFKNLRDFDTDGWVGTSHNLDLFAGVAYPMEVVQDSRGLRVSGKWHSTPDAQTVRTKVKERLAAGKAVRGSIGYKVLDSVKGMLDGKSVTRLKSLDLFEVSFVNIPANPAASVLSAKSHEADPNVLTLDALKRWLDAETKAGRVLSRSNHSKLREWRGTLESMLSQLAEMCDAHDPDRDNEANEADEATRMIPIVDYVEAGKSANELRAALLRARLSLLKPSI